MSFLRQEGDVLFQQDNSGAVVEKKTGPTHVADFRAVFTAERPYLFLGPETTYPVEQ